MNEYVYDFSVDHNSIDVDDTLDIRKYLMKNMFIFIKQMLVGLLSFGGSLATKYVSLNNQPCVTKPTLVDLNPDDLRYDPFIFSLDRCYRSCNVLNDLSVPN